MSVIKKTLFDEKLEKVNVLINDTDTNSKYFKITELNDTFTGGKNAFLIQGSEFLVADTLIKIQIKDANGDTIYYEPGEGIVSSSVNGESFVSEYYEGTSKVVSVYIYPNKTIDANGNPLDGTAFGPATITILGELKEYESNGLTLPVPDNWKDTYNVKWQKTINVNPSLPNVTKIRFYKRPVAKITELLQPLYSIDTGSGLKVDSGISQSFAQINLSNLETFAGDVKRVKVYRTSEGDISDYDLIQDVLLESKELLTTYGLSGSVIGETGIFTSETLQKYWNTGSLKAELTSSRVESGLKLSGSGLFVYTQSLDINSANTYELNLDAFYSSSVSSNLGIYLSYTSQSTTVSSSIGTLYGTTPTKNLKDTVIPFSIASNYPSASLYFSQSNGEWHLGNISLKLSQDTAFSPDSVSFITTMPTILGNDVFNFKFEFYDLNNNYVPVFVTQSATFVGAPPNTNALVSASLSQSLDALYKVSSSISGTMTVYSSSASGSISVVSGSVNTLSGSVYTLSASVSSSNATILSSSLSKVQQLANGQFSGSFIGDTVIYSPAIGGQVGYIKELFTVGDTSAAQINLDARTSTRKIYIGTGAYNNTNTAIYLDSAGQFSLKDQLTWNGTNLSVNGTINVTGGNAATDANALLYSQRAAASASISASTAYIRLQSLADGGYSGSFIGSTTIYSPNIGGQNGYISNIFKVGQGGITIDGGNKKIYVGTGTYGNANTPFYFASGSTNVFSLGDKLTFDGTNLSVNGNGTFSGNLSAAGGSFTGTLVAAGGSFSGQVSAASGQIGGWTINSSSIYVPSAISLDSSAKSITISDTSAVPRILINQNTAFSSLTAGSPSTVSAITTVNSGVYSFGDYDRTLGTVATVSGRTYNITSTFTATNGINAITLSAGAYSISVYSQIIVDNGVTTIVVGEESDGISGYNTAATWSAINGKVKNTTLTGNGNTWTVIQRFKMSIIGAPGGTYASSYTQPAVSVTLAGANSFVEIIAGGIQVGRDSANYVIMDRTGTNPMLQVGGDGTFTGDVTANTSDRRLKNNIRVIDNPLEKLSKINGVYFNWNDVAKELANKNDIEEVGFLAQEVQSVLPHIIKPAPFDIDTKTGESKSGENYLTIQYEKIVPLLVECIKELKSQIDELKNK
jgi:hypothetical protein